MNFDQDHLNPPPRRVAICLVAHLRSDRDRQLFEMSVESLLALERPKEIELQLLAVDNASPLGLKSILVEKGWSQAVQLIERTSNNLGAARDQGLRAASQATDWFGFVDSDIEVPKVWLRRIVEFIEKDDRAKAEPVAGIAIANVQGKESNFARALDLAMSSPLMHLGSAQALQNRHPLSVSHLSSCAVLYRRELLLSCGGFDSAFSVVCEDLEMSYRLRPLGKLWLLPEPPVLHRQDSEWRSWAKRMFRYGWGQIEVARRHPRHVLGTKGLPLLALAIGMGALIFALVGHPMPLVMLVVQYLAVVSGLIMGAALARGEVRRALLAVALTFLTHAAYAIGMGAGLVGLKKNPNRN